ncbi:ShlB/FhaC/HecB family hemolysin secretion/activation protein [Parasphingopyxis lamellibrachiae]|uniref:Hemolysin activation/secretion protein n=1 Tax=Parasphingopyxis lamellibrachiae TaxID=680125 RepID=A0A3D9FFB4_9SPHN|nr:ShlB/FhaC/HecB family hemolysin secretion/activation protein [Parasphingopyxis lamellibrachiae]RED15771.1 hemolysin activation/secretion protein [Parasphingopyxis lamellibrachiae]
MSLRVFGFIALAAIVAAEPGVAVAQSGPAPTREEIQPDRLTPGTGQPADRLEVEGGIERAPCPLAQPQFAAIRFRLSDAVFANLRGISADRIRPAFADYLGQEVPISIVCEIRDRAASILRSEGYLAAVQVPPQQIGDDGIVRFDVLMASMSRIQVRGDAGNSENLIARYLRPLGEMEVFNQREAERSLLLARNLPGFETRLTLRPAEGVPGEVIGDVRVERTPFILEGNIQNYASRSTGRFGGQIRAQINDVTGLGDSTTLAVFSSADFNEQLVLNASHSFAIGDSGLRLGGTFTYAWNDPTVGGVSPFDTQTLVTGFDLSYPFILDQATSLVGTAGFDFIDQDVRFGGAALNRDKLRVAYARAALYTSDRRSIDGVGGYSAAEPRWRFGIAGEVRQGLDIFDATEPGFPVNGVPQTRAAGKADATVLRIDGLAELRPTPDIAFVIEPRLQWTSDPLLSYEEFSGGNYTVGRGFDPGSVIGDRGIGFRYEFRYGSALPRTRESWAFQPYGFFDAAWVGNEDPAALGGTGSDELYSTGVGLRANYGDRVRLDTTFAIPLNRTNFQANRPSPRLLLSLLLRFAH